MVRGTEEDDWHTTSGNAGVVHVSSGKGSDEEEKLSVATEVSRLGRIRCCCLSLITLLC